MFEKELIEQAPSDASRPGGLAEIEGQDRKLLFEQPQQPPAELGYDQQAWSARLLLHHVKEEYGVEYHENYAYELLREAGLSATVQSRAFAKTASKYETSRRSCPD